LLGAVAGAWLGGRRGPGPGARTGPRPDVVAVAPVAVSALLTLIIAVAVWTNPGVRTGTLTLVPTGTVPFWIGLYVDGLSAVVAFMVCCVALAVQIYSVAFMSADPRYSSYSAFLALCTAAMLLVVLAGDLIVLYVGWEVMGLCSCFLIGHRRANADRRAAVRAFVVTHIGDVAFLFGIFVLGLEAGTFSVRDVVAHHYPHGTALAGTLLLVAGVAGKSAQFPAHLWLPDTMLAPIPIGALIHAATMVAAGIYVVARLFPAFLQAPATLTVLGVMAAISMLGAALAALAQDDLKRVLAYSTISQAAYMATGLAAGARDAAIFQLLAHGAAKALLVLAAGCVITVVGSDLLRDMGGLRLAMPVTFWSMTIGWAALAGIPVAAGSFGNAAIIAAARHGESSGIAAWAAVLMFVTLLLTIAVTGAYATRAWLMTFFGERRRGKDPAAARPAPAVQAVQAVPAVPALMRLPVAALAVPALGLGFFGFGSAELRPEPVPAILELLMVAAGAGAAFVVWNRDPALDPARLLGRPIRGLLARGFYRGDTYDRVTVRSVRVLAGFVVAVDDRVVDSVVVTSGRAVRRLGGALPGTRGGNPQAYLTGLLAGVAVIALAVVVFR